MGHATQRKLNYYGIRTIGQLAQTNPETLHGWFGKVGYSLSAFARGLDVSPVARQDHVAAVKSVGNSGTTPRDLVNNEDVWLMLWSCLRVWPMRMRELNMKCTVVEVSVRDSDLNGFVRQRKIETPTSSSLEIAQVAFDLFKSNYRWGQPLRGVGVRGASLVPADTPVQLGFFCNAERERKTRTGWTRRWMACANGTGIPASSGRGSTQIVGWGAITRRTTTRCIRWGSLTRDNEF